MVERVLDLLEPQLQLGVLARDLLELLVQVLVVRAQPRFHALDLVAERLLEVHVVLVEGVLRDRVVLADELLHVPDLRLHLRDGVAVVGDLAHPRLLPRLDVVEAVRVVLHGEKVLLEVREDLLNIFAQRVQLDEIRIIDGLSSGSRFALGHHAGSLRRLLSARRPTVRRS